MTEFIAFPARSFAHKAALPPSNSKMQFKKQLAIYTETVGSAVCFFQSVNKCLTRRFVSLCSLDARKNTAPYARAVFAAGVLHLISVLSVRRLQKKINKRSQIFSRDQQKIAQESTATKEVNVFIDSKKANWKNPRPNTEGKLRDIWLQKSQSGSPGLDPP